MDERTPPNVGYLYGIRTMYFVLSFNYNKLCLNNCVFLNESVKFNLCCDIELFVDV